MNMGDVAVIVMTVASVLAVGCLFLAYALEETRRTAPSDDSDLPPLDYRQYRGY